MSRLDRRCVCRVSDSDLEDLSSGDSLNLDTFDRVTTENNPARHVKRQQEKVSPTRKRVVLYESGRNPAFNKVRETNIGARFQVSKESESPSATTP
jgi:hypothetical protein